MCNICKRWCAISKGGLFTQLECVAVSEWGKCGRMSVVNFYNPSLNLIVDDLEDIMEAVQGLVVWVGDFNAHNPLWGSGHRDTNGEVVEDFMDHHGLVCLNENRPTRFDIRTGSLSCIDLSLVSAQLAGKAKWDTLEESTIGSDPFPILIRFGQSLLEQHVRPRLLIGQSGRSLLQLVQGS